MRDVRVGLACQPVELARLDELANARSELMNRPEPSDDAKLSSPGRAFASCTKSFVDFAGSDKGTMTSIGAEAIRLTGGAGKEWQGKRYRGDHRRCHCVIA